MAQWSIRPLGGQAVRVQSAAEPFLFISFFFLSFFFFFFFGAGGEGGGVGCRCLFLYCLVFSLFSLFSFSFNPTAHRYLIFKRFCDTRISRY